MLWDVLTLWINYPWDIILSFLFGPHYIFTVKRFLGTQVTASYQQYQKHITLISYPPKSSMFCNFILEWTTQGQRLKALPAPEFVKEYFQKTIDCRDGWIIVTNWLRVKWFIWFKCHLGMSISCDVTFDWLPTLPAWLAGPTIFASRYSVKSNHRVLALSKFYAICFSNI